MSTLAVEFRLLVKDSPRDSSKAESPINRSAKAIIVGTLLPVDKIIYFIFVCVLLYIQKTGTVVVVT